MGGTDAVPTRGTTGSRRPRRARSPSARALHSETAYEGSTAPHIMSFFREPMSCFFYVPEDRASALYRKPLPGGRPWGPGGGTSACAREGNSKANTLRPHRQQAMALFSVLPARSLSARPIDEGRAHLGVHDARVCRA